MMILQVSIKMKRENPMLVMAMPWLGFSGGTHLHATTYILVPTLKAHQIDERYMYKWEQ